MTTLDPRAVKAESESIILAAGGQINEWLPTLDVEARKARSLEEIRARALVMNALINIAFGAPVKVIAEWITRHGVDSALSETERSILSRRSDQLTEQEKTNLHWYLESLWALMWVGSVFDDLDFEEGVPNSMASFCPNLEKNEDGSKFDGFSMRSYEEIFSELDLHYRLHWYARNGSLTGTPTPPVELSVMIERRKALEWVLDRESDWDDVELST